MLAYWVFDFVSFPKECWILSWQVVVVQIDFFALLFSAPQTPQRPPSLKSPFCLSHSATAAACWSPLPALQPGKGLWGDGWGSCRGYWSASLLSDAVLCVPRPMSGNSCFLSFAQFSSYGQWEGNSDYSIMASSRNESFTLENTKSLRRSSNCCG